MKSPLLPLLLILMTFSISGAEASQQDNTPQEDSLTILPARKDSVAVLQTMVITSEMAHRNQGIKSHGSFAFDSRDINRTAGAAGDISRYLATLPAIVSGLSDKFDNTLYVRGGRPSEVSFMIDGVEFENINHFSKANGSGGPVGFLNSDYVRSARFYAGNVPAALPSRLSSVIDIAMKSGSLSSMHGQVGAKLTGGLFSLDGPIQSSKISFALAGRYVNFSALKSIIGDEGLPRLGDLYAKILFLPSERLDISAFGLFSRNRYDYGYPVSERGDDGIRHPNELGEVQQISQGGAGLSLRYHNGVFKQEITAGYTARNGTSYDSIVQFADTFYMNHYAKNPIRSQGDDRSHMSIQTATSLIYDEDHSVSAGARINHTEYDFKSTNQFQYDGECIVCQNGEPVSAYKKQTPIERFARLEDNLTSAFVQASFTMGPLSSMAGIRADYCSLIEDLTFSPRLAAMLPMGNKGNLSGSVGLYNQFPTDLPTIVFNYLAKSKNVPPEAVVSTEWRLLKQARPLRCWQGAIGYDIPLWNKLQARCELYYKWYDQEYQFVIPGVQDIVFRNAQGEPMLKEQIGERKSYGLEWSFNSLEPTRLFYSVSGSFFDVKNRFRDIQWYNDWTNVSFTFTASAGMRLLANHSIALSFHASGGRPFCAQEIQVDCIGRRTSAIETTHPFFEERLEQLFATNLRYGYTRSLSRIELEGFVEIINLLNYRPVLEYKFNGDQYQNVRPFGITPIIGLIARF